MTLGAGTRLGVYEIIAPLGAGGMGEVYRARDTRLGRDVAIKVLPAAFVTDPERVARFEREAQLLASLNHPNIAAIYGLEEVRRDRSSSSSNSSKAKRWPIGSRPAPALLDRRSARHRSADRRRARSGAREGHRPSRSEAGQHHAHADGHVKVLDFGLAKFDTGASGSDFSNSPTLTFAATQAGVILGTAAYMSPEQAKGRTADKRSDVWAFGCVLYEMLAGRRAFEGEDLSDTLASVIKSEPDWTALPAERAGPRAHDSQGLPRKRSPGTDSRSCGRAIRPGWDRRRGRASG